MSNASNVSEVLSCIAEIQEPLPSHLTQVKGQGEGGGEENKNMTREDNLEKGNFERIRNWKETKEGSYEEQAVDKKGV